MDWKPSALCGKPLPCDRQVLRVDVPFEPFGAHAHHPASTCAVNPGSTARLAGQCSGRATTVSHGTDRRIVILVRNLFEMGKMGEAAALPYCLAQSWAERRCCAALASRQSRRFALPMEEIRDAACREPCLPHREKIQLVAQGGHLYSRRSLSNVARKINQ